MCCGAIHSAGIRRIAFGVRAEQMVQTIEGEE